MQVSEHVKNTIYWIRLSRRRFQCVVRRQGEPMPKLSRDEKIDKARKYADGYTPSPDQLISEIQSDRRKTYIAGFLQGMECAGGSLDIPSEEVLKRLEKAEQAAELADFIRRRFADVVFVPDSASWEHIWEKVRSRFESA